MMMMHYIGGMQPAEWLRQRNAAQRSQSQPTQHLLASVHRHALWTVTATASHWLRRRDTWLLVWRHIRRRSTNQLISRWTAEYLSSRWYIFDPKL